MTHQNDELAGLEISWRGILWLVALVLAAIALAGATVVSLVRG